MHIVRTKIHKERTATVRVDKAHGVRQDAVGNILVAPKCPSAALHISDARNTVHNALVVTVRRVQFCQQFRVCLTGRFTLEVLDIAHADGGLRVVVCHPSVFDIYTRHTVSRSRHDVMVIEAQVCRRNIQFAVPVLFTRLAAQSQVPFTNSRCGISGTVHQVCHRVLFRLYDGSGIARSHVGASAAEGVFTRQHAIARRSRS
ncbi:uncharacterized protein BN805_00710 [Prevotella sp. CAG:891]|nr:uncharacterized protein BN805_00710 [Prevotella sp. CAG:891]